jgi:hypothetical protein
MISAAADSAARNAARAADSAVFCTVHPQQLDLRYRPCERDTYDPASINA